MLDRILEAIKEYYNRGAALPSKMHDKLDEAFEYRNKLAQLFSVKLEDSPVKMKESLEKAGYTLEEIKKLKRYASGNDLFVVDAYMYAMEDKRDEFFLSAATYFRTISSDELESGEAMFGSSTVAELTKYASKLIDRGYYKDNVIAAINSYSETGEIDISKLGNKMGTGVKVRLVQPLATSAELTKIEKDKQALFAAFPDLKELAESLKNADSSANVDGAKDFSELDTSVPDYTEPFSILGENNGVKYMSVNPDEPVNFVPISDSYCTKRMKIKRKSKRMLPMFDVSSLKMKMAKAFLRLMKVDSSELSAEGNERVM